MRSREQSLGDLIHCFVVIRTGKEVAVAIHCHLKCGVSSEGLHRLGCEAGFDPARHSEVSEAVPVETLDGREGVKERQEFSLDQIVSEKFEAGCSFLQEDCLVVHRRETKQDEMIPAKSSFRDHG
jgi:hypothetical protein